MTFIINNYISSYAESTNIQNYKLCNIILLLFFSYIVYFSFNKKLIYTKYINDCIKRKNYFKNDEPIKNIEYYLSICVPVYNMEKYIEVSLLSIINQSFQNYEIILVNDNSNDKTLEIINKYQKKNNRIKIISHQQKLGVYCSRKDAILNANGEFILMLDPDDMLMNNNLFQELYNYNLKYNLDISEFLVYHKNESEINYILPDNHIYSHLHNFNETIIYQPKLSNLLFYSPNSNNITSIICRIIWNKLIRRNIMIKAVEYVEKTFRSRLLITADDTPINIMVFNFATNYSNIKIPGYLYIKKKVSMSRGQHVKKLDKIRGYNFLLYYQFLFGYIKKYKKDINYFFKDFDGFHHDLYKIKNMNIVEYIPKAINFFKKLLKIENIPNSSKLILKKLLVHFKK